MLSGKISPDTSDAEHMSVVGGVAGSPVSHTSSLYPVRNSFNHLCLSGPDRSVRSLSLPAMRQALSHAQKDLELQMGRLDAFSPLKVLGRGYAIAEKMPEKTILRSSKQVRPGDRIRVRLHQGQIHRE